MATILSKINAHDFRKNAKIFGWTHRLNKTRHACIVHDPQLLEKCVATMVLNSALCYYTHHDPQNNKCRWFLTKWCIGFSSPTTNFLERCSSFSQLLCQRCLHCAWMLRPLPLQWIAPTHQLINHQNRGNTVIPLSGTDEPDPLCSSFAWAHLLFAWDIVAATVARDVAFICKLCLTSHTLWCVGVLHLSVSCVLHLRINCVQLLCVVFVFLVKLIYGFLSPSCKFVCFSCFCLYLDNVSLICIFIVTM